MCRELRIGVVYVDRYWSNWTRPTGDAPELRLWSRFARGMHVNMAPAKHRQRGRLRQRSYSRPASQSGARAPGVRDFAALASAPPYAPVNIVVADRRSARGGPRGRAVTTALADSPARAGRMSSFRTYLGRKLGDTNRPAPEHFPPNIARGTCRAGPPAPSGPFLRTLAGWLIGSSLARR